MMRTLMHAKRTIAAENLHATSGRQWRRAALPMQRRLGNQGFQAMLAAQGARLPAELRAEMEARFGHDFSAARLHVGADAAHAAEAIGAEAFTLGQNIVFAGGSYTPGTEAGRALLAHELAHVVQQGRGGPAPSGDPESALEAEASRAAEGISGDGPVAISGASGVGVARQNSPFEEEQKRRLTAAMLGQDPPQANQPLLSILNGAFFSGNNPVGTLSTDIFGGLAGQSTTDPSVGPVALPTLTLQVRDRLSLTDEVGVFGGVGSIAPLFGPRNPRTGLWPKSVTTGSLGLTWHHGPEAPDDESRYIPGFGYWLTLGQAWGLQPEVEDAPAPPGWSFNPTANAMFAWSWARAKHGQADLIAGSGLSRWGQINGVPVGGFLSPYLGFSYTWAVNDANSIYAEIEGGPYLGLAGRYDTGSGFPASLYTSGGIGWQRTRGDWGFGAEIWGFAEPFSSVATPARDFPQGPFGNWGLGLRFNLTGINPRRNRFLDDPF
jgi:hypothetical protein